MLSLRVRDLDAMVAQLRTAEVRIDSQETEEGAGRFAWLVDPRRQPGRVVGALPRRAGAADRRR